MIIIVAIAVVASAFFLYYARNDVVAVNEPVATSTVTTATANVYKNSAYGFTFTLPASWQGYSVVSQTWKGTVIKTNTIEQNGAKFIIRNPKWTTGAPYEDLPILVFTTAQWNSYTAEDFSISAAPVKATELARNNKYVFALPPRWDFDYSLDYKEAQDIIAGSPLQAFNRTAESL